MMLADSLQGLWHLTLNNGARSSNRNRGIDEVWTIKWTIKLKEKKKKNQKPKKEW